MTERDDTFDGSEGRIVLRTWDGPAPRHVAVIAHGYGEHIDRYAHVARKLVERGATVWGPDHLGHGRSDGERALVTDVEHVVDDLHRVVTMARAAHPGVPLVLIGHSMGGMIATRYAQRHAKQLTGLVLSAPAIGALDFLDALLSMPEIPQVPIDPAVLSRDVAAQRQYADDPLVWHGGFKRPTLQAFRRAVHAIAAGPSFGDLPTLYVHGTDDQLVPMASTRAAMAHVRGTDFTERLYDGARHELFNETNQDAVLREVGNFVDRVTRT